MNKSNLGPRGPRKVPNQISANGPRQGRPIPATSKPTSHGPRQPKTIPLSDSPTQVMMEGGPRQPKVIPKSA